MARAQRSLLPPSSSPNPPSNALYRSGRSVRRGLAFSPAGPSLLLLSGPATHGLPSLCIAPLEQGRHPLHRPPVPRLSIPLFFIQHTAPRFLQRPSPPIELAALAAYAEGVVPLRLRRAVTKPGPDAGHGGAGGLGPRRPRPLAASPRRRPGPGPGQRPSIGRLAVALWLPLIPGRGHCPFYSALGDHEKRRARRNGRALKGDALTWD